MKLREFLNTFSLFLDDNKEKLVQTNEDSEPHTILIDSDPLHKEEDTEKFDIKEAIENQFTVVDGINYFETRFLTLLNYLSSYREAWMKQRVIDFPFGEKIEFKANKNLYEFLQWKSMDISYNNFNFIIDFVIAVNSLSEYFPITIPFKNYKYDETTKSLVFTIEDHYSNKIKYNFDLYTVPETVNTIFNDNILESYISGEDSNSMYLCIEYIDPLHNYKRSITIVNREKIDYYENDKFLLESILTRTYDLCIRMYKDILVNIVDRYFSISCEFLDEFLRIR